jgi:hypothetical protein
VEPELEEFDEPLVMLMVVDVCEIVVDFGVCAESTELKRVPQKAAKRSSYMRSGESFKPCG